ncbi:MAG TPA: hypothetical protein VFQ44_12225 [Streptosporangiaceae bacterium]|nr:hypothetical protein [Streptosporangiaceae bacterium]
MARWMLSVATADLRRSLPPLQLTMVNSGGSSAWSREEIYGDDGR